MGDPLRAVIVMDYQNVHLTGHDLFPSSRLLARHETLIDPLLYAGRLIAVRNRLQRPGMSHAALARVLAFRGQPTAENDPADYARSQAQAAHWTRDPRVVVTLRPLRYSYGHTPDGRRVVAGKREKGIDVLCALAVVREAADPDVDLVILASTDTDLLPAIEEARTLGTAKIETASWYHPSHPPHARGFELRLGRGHHPHWNTRLTETDFTAARDLTRY